MVWNEMTVIETDIFIYGQEKSAAWYTEKRISIESIAEKQWTKIRQVSTVSFQYLSTNKALTRFENCFPNQRYSHMVANGFFSNERYNCKWQAIVDKRLTSPDSATFDYLENV